MKVTVVGVSHSGERVTTPEIYANWELGQRRIKELEPDYPAEYGFDVWAVEEFVRENLESDHKEGTQQ